ncbi:hypothetical protein [Rhodococcus sp. IEGM 1379]|uniref:hypothetical protein n=1 Tax=Rhodococcus sp. IEGM 1379 TaxID=3047086 RepID=UPI0024B80BEF|nr:hypothetical protein [Rhodococcus sp. IEGM 1379]MDI9918366.1 hypothetical protein [Rhodococcus sp. IEGM 1379]
MRRNLTRSVILTAGLFLAAAPAVAHAQDSVGGGSLPAGSSVLSGSATLWEANRFNRTYTPQQIKECWDVAAPDGVTTGQFPGACPSQPITALDLFAGNLLFGSMG